MAPGSLQIGAKYSHKVQEHFPHQASPFPATSKNQHFSIFLQKYTYVSLALPQGLFFPSKIQIRVFSAPAVAFLSRKTTYSRLQRSRRGFFFPQNDLFSSLALPQGLFSPSKIPKRPIIVFSAPAGAFFPSKKKQQPIIVFSVPAGAFLFPPKRPILVFSAPAGAFFSL